MKEASHDEASSVRRSCRRRDFHAGADRACDGFVIAAGVVPGGYDDFSRLVVPELQRRGLHHLDYAGPTLRENLGLRIPRAADYHAKRGK